MKTALIIIHVIISVILIVSVLMQHGKQQGLSGAIAGGAETFFGKNKGRTIDGVLKKVTAVVAVLFVITSIGLAAFSAAGNKTTDDQEIQTTVDEAGNVVDEDGNIIMTAEDMAAAAEGETETPVEETAEDNTAAAE